MCGIAGAIHLNAQIDEDTTLSIRDRLSHRGPHS
jgi:asparagine synthetase B (glutamine-hydrolysing)